MIKKMSGDGALTAKRCCPKCGIWPNNWRYLYNSPKKPAPFDCKGCGSTLVRSKGLSKSVTIAIVTSLLFYFNGKPIFQSLFYFTVFMLAGLTLLLLEIWVTEFTIFQPETDSESLK